MQIFNETNWKRATAANTHLGYLQTVRKPSPVTTAIPNCAIPDKPWQLSPPLKEPVPAEEQSQRPDHPASPVPSPRPSTAIRPRQRRRIAATTRTDIAMATNLAPACPCYRRLRLPEGFAREEYGHDNLQSAVPAGIRSIAWARRRAP